MRQVDGFVVVTPDGDVVSRLIQNEGPALIVAMMDGQPGCKVVRATLVLHESVSRPGEGA